MLTTQVPLELFLTPGIQHSQKQNLQQPDFQEEKKCIKRLCRWQKNCKFRIRLSYFFSNSRQSFVIGSD